MFSWKYCFNRESFSDGIIVGHQYKYNSLGYILLFLPTQNQICALQKFVHISLKMLLIVFLKVFNVEN